MSLLRQRKVVLLSLSLSLIVITSCRSQSDVSSTENAPQQTVVSSTPPFQTKEPDRYRAVRTITITNAAGETVVTRSSIAKDGEMRRHETEAQDKRIVYLDVPEGRFVLLPDEKIYADLASENDAGLSEQEDTSPEGLLHSDVNSTSYQKIGTESIGGRNATKYRVVVNNSGSGNVSVSETLIWIDDALRMPIRSETTSGGGSKVIMELSDVTLEVDKRMFQVPTDYKKVKSISHKEAQKSQM